MALNLNQNLSQSQILSPQMRQGLELLQASSMELSQMVQQALISNPVLEQTDEFEELKVETPEDSEKDAEVLDNLADDYREDQITQNQTTSTGLDQDAIDFIYNSIIAPKTLQQHLLNQLNLSGKPPSFHHAGEIVIGYLNDRGFLTESLEDICAKERIPMNLLVSAKASIQSFDPPGVGASNIKESLLIQLSHMKINTGIIVVIVEEHLKALALRKFPEIAKKIGTSQQAVAEAAKVISSLRSNPGADFDPTMNPQIQADVIVSFGVDGKLRAHLTDAYLPKLSISSGYKELLSMTPDTDVRKFLKENIRDGRTLIKSISQRQDTILRIVEVLIDKQQAFFSKGPQALKPLTMNEVAETIKVHPTTISRACAMKYILTPVGMFELRYFFSTAIENNKGESFSNTSIRDQIKEIVENEDPKKPYTDTKIEKILQSKGIKVARRTISKYREQMDILPSNMRKQF